VLNVGAPELMVILVIALIVLGPNKLPEAARQVGKALGEIRRVSSGFQAEMRDAMQEPIRPAAPTAPEPELPARPARRAPLRASSEPQDEGGTSA
jgi:Tat protein translocase TatB subunit